MKRNTFNQIVDGLAPAALFVLIATGILLHFQLPSGAK